MFPAKLTVLNIAVTMILTAFVIIIFPMTDFYRKEVKRWQEGEKSFQEMEKEFRRKLDCARADSVCYEGKKPTENEKVEKSNPDL